MNARTAIAIAAAALAFAAPSLASQRPGSNPYAEARYELSAMQRDAYQVRDGYLRTDLLRRIQRTEALVTRIEAEARQDRWDNGNHHGWENNHHGDNQHGMTFEEAMARVERESFDSGKLEIIVRLAEHQKFTTREARALASTLTFDDKRADALIALYPAVVDKERFWTTLDILTFDSSKRRVQQTTHC